MIESFLQWSKDVGLGVWVGIVVSLFSLRISFSSLRESKRSREQALQLHIANGPKPECAVIEHRESYSSKVEVEIQVINTGRMDFSTKLPQFNVGSRKGFPVLWNIKDLPGPAGPTVTVKPNDSVSWKLDRAGIAERMDEISKDLPERKDLQAPHFVRIYVETNANGGKALRSYISMVDRLTVWDQIKLRH